jgi:hypothetical protein
MEFGDPDTAGTPPPVVPTAPPAPDPTDYISQGFILRGKVRAEPSRDIVHVISEDRAKLEIIGPLQDDERVPGHCIRAHGRGDEVLRESGWP